MPEFKQSQQVYYNQQINKVTPHFTFMRRAQNADTHARKQHRLSQNISAVCSSFELVIASDMHLESESEKRVKNVDFHTAEYIQIQATLFSLFLDEFLSTDLRPIYRSLTCRSPRNCQKRRHERITPNEDSQALVALLSTRSYCLQTL